MPESINPALRKYAGIDLAGRLALWEKGGIQEFAGFPESLKNRLNVALCFTTDSEDQIKTRVIEPVKEIANELSIGFIIAGQDYPIHTTLMEGLYEGGNPQEREHEFSQVITTPSIQDLDKLVGNKVVYKFLLIDKGNLLLTAKIPDWVLAAREQLAESYKAQGLKPLLIDNVLHISLARMISLPPKDEQAQAFRTYEEKMTQLRSEVAANPLTLSVACISKMPAFDLLHRKP